MFRQQNISIVEPGIAKIAGEEEATLKQVMEEFVKMQALTTQLDEKLARRVQELEKMRLAGVKFDPNAQEQMVKVEENITQINEAQGTIMEAISQKTEAVELAQRGLCRRELGYIRLVL